MQLHSNKVVFLALLALHCAVADTEFNVTEVLNIVTSNEITLQATIYNFYRYEYLSDELIGLVHDATDVGQVAIWANSETPTTINYSTFYRSRGKYEFFSSVSWPFTALMYIENSGGKVKSFSIQVSGGAGADGGGKIISYIGDFNLDQTNWTIKYTVNQIYDAGDPTICEVYFAIYQRAMGTPSLNGKYSSSTNTLKSTVSLSNYPRRAWMGYTLLSRVKGQVILQEEVEKAVRTIAQEIIGIEWIVEKIKCSTIPLIVQWQRTKHSLDPMYTMQLQDTASGQTTNTSVHFLISKPPSITITEIRPAMPRFCSTVTRLSTPEKTVVVEQKTGWVEGTLAAFSTIIHENKNGREPFRVGILDVL